MRASYTLIRSLSKGEDQFPPLFVVVKSKVTVT